jgi:Zn-dependent peptidase ImmA (M78 family)
MARRAEDIRLGGAIPSPTSSNGQTLYPLVVARARELIQETRNRFPNWDPPPFDPTFYARVLGIPIKVTYEPVPWDAFLVPTGNGYCMVCNGLVKSVGRRWFTVGHEIVHTFFDGPEATLHYRSSHRSLTQDEYTLERLCDAGAAELLMPADAFRLHTGAGFLPASNLIEVARRFRVSLEATAVRYVESSRLPCAVIFLEYGAKPSAEKLRRDSGGFLVGKPTFRVSRSYSSWNFPFVFPRGKSVPRGSAIIRAAVLGHEAEAVERFTLRASEVRCRVSAVPLRRGWKPAPPPVCAVAELLESR